MSTRTSTTPTTSLCLSCSSTIPPKLISTSYYTPCCSSPICSRCLTVNPRLKEYVPCLRCGDGVQTAMSRSGMRAGRSGSDVDVRGPIAIETDNQFALGDQSDSESDGSPTEFNHPHPSDRPPSYTSHLDRSPTARSRMSDLPPSTKSRSSSVISKKLEDGVENGVEEGTGSEALQNEEEDGEEYVEPMRHMVMKGETIRGLASRYELDPYDLLKINSLPFEALQSNPHLLQTRRDILLSRPKPLKGRKENVMEVGGEKWFDQDEEEQRKEERRLKRFQLVTKTHDTAIARAYLAVQEIEDSSSFAQGSGSGEVLFSFGDEMESEDKKATKKAGLPPGENGRENRAANKFFEDDDWEHRQGQGSSRLAGSGKKEKKTGRHIDGRSFRAGELVHGAPWLEK